MYLNKAMYIEVTRNSLYNGQNHFGQLDIDFFRRESHATEIIGRWQ